jgi:murein L,D-transpeptidase YafK
MRILYLIVVLIAISLQTGCSLQPPAQSWQTLTASTVDYYALSAEARLLPYFQRAGISYPPREVALLVFKQEKKLELWASNGYVWRLIKIYPILAASGGPGPKLREGDDQVPEGIYKITSLNPHSRFHLSLDLNYPNAFDRQHACWDHRCHPGSNIFIHGHAVSIGCIAIGDRAIEELFVLIYKTGLQQVTVIIAPNDLRTEQPLRNRNKSPRWLPLLYRNISQALTPFKGNNHALIDYPQT